MAREQVMNLSIAKFNANGSKKFLENSVRNSVPKKGWNRWKLGAVLGLVGALIFPILGALISEAGKSEANVSGLLQTFAFLLTLSGIPFLAFGIYCLIKAVERALPRRNYYGSRRQLPDTRKPNNSEIA